MTQSHPVAGVLSAHLRTESVPVFLGGANGQADRLTLHVPVTAQARGMAARTQKALREGGFDIAVAVKPYRERALTKARSLDQLVRGFRHDLYLFDPTATVGRAVVVLDSVSQTRRVLGRLLIGAYLDPVARVIYAVIDQKDAAQADHIAKTLLEQIDQATLRTGSEFNRPPLTVQVVTMLPMRPLVAVDRASYRRRPVVVGSTLRGWRAAAAGLATAFGIGAASVAVAQAPAVSGLNGKLDVRGGYLKNDAESGGLAGFVTGSVAAPLGTSFGIQVDAAAGIADGHGYWGGGGHLFWRDPAKGLVGVFGQGAGFRGAELYRAGVEAEWYLGNFTLGGYGGYQIGNDTRRIHVDDGVIAGISLKFYTSDNFVLKLGAGIEDSSGYVRGGFEYQPGFAALPGLSIFADGGAGTDHHAYALAGIRIYFGANKSLIRRHREDDPDVLPLAEIQKFERKQRFVSGTSPYSP